MSDAPPDCHATDDDEHPPNDTPRDDGRPSP